MAHNTTVEAVVFDIGNVLHLWDPRNLYRKLISDVQEREWFLGNICTPAWNAEMDRGRDWDNEVKRLSALYPGYKDWIAAYHERWIEMCAGPVAGTVEIMMRLKAKDYPVYALTNYSHEKLRLAAEQYPFLNQFDGRIVSSDEGVVKPEPEIFERLFDRFCLTPDRLVYMDDSPVNVEAGKRSGIHNSFLFTEPERLRQDMAALGLPV